MCKAARSTLIAFFVCYAVSAAGDEFEIDTQ